MDGDPHLDETCLEGDDPFLDGGIPLEVGPPKADGAHPYGGHLVNSPTQQGSNTPFEENRTQKGMGSKLIYLLRAYSCANTFVHLIFTITHFVSRLL